MTDERVPGSAHALPLCARPDFWRSVQDTGERRTGRPAAAGYLSVEVESGAGSGAAKGLAGGAALGGGGGGALREGGAQGATPVPGPPSSPEVAPGPEDGPGQGPQESGPAALGLALPPKSSSSKVTHPRGGLALAAPGKPAGCGRGKGAGSRGPAASASASRGGARNGFMPGRARAGANGLGEPRASSWDRLRAGSGGRAGAQLRELGTLPLLRVAGGRAGEGRGAGGGASRLRDRSSSGSLFEGGSSARAGPPGVTCYPVGRSCGCAEGSEGRLWEDLLRGGGWGGVSKPGGGAGWGGGAAVGTRGSGIFGPGGAA